jgi:hypothetical protein
MELRQVIQVMEKSAAVPGGTGDRFAGYGVMGQPFRSGHVLALRRFPASSLGQAFTSVWHRDPAGVWTFYSDVSPDQSCGRYFNQKMNRNVITPIHLTWTGPSRLRVTIPYALDWDIAMTESVVSRAMNALTKLVPTSWWQNRAVLRAMGTSAGAALSTGPLTLAGRTPNDQEFIAIPNKMWLVGETRAIVNDVDAGPAGALQEQARLRDFLIPQRGVFAIAQAFMESHEPRIAPEVRLAGRAA